MILLSIIIPVYNVEEYLCKCLNSIITQCDDRVQIILVDDGSSDNSIKSAENIINNNENIEVHFKSNGGLSSARNFGISKSVGKYIYFVDSDDYILDNSLKKILNKLESSNANYFVFNHMNTEQIQRFGMKSNSVDEFNTITATDYLKHHKNPITNVWRVIVSKDLIVKNKIMFREGVLCEDIEWLTKLLIKLDKIVASNILLYAYNNQREGSIMNVLSVKRIADTANNVKISKELAETLQDGEKKEAFLKLLFVEWCANLSFYAMLKKEQKQNVDLADCFKKDTNIMIIRIYNIINKIITIEGTAKILYYFKVIRKWLKLKIKKV